jgi:fructose-bisphosphate aldolase class I
MTTNDLAMAAQRLVAGGRGIFPIDEAPALAALRFGRFGIAANPQSRRAYRELVATAPAIERYVGGMILDREGLRQTATDGRRFVDILRERGIAVGISLDEGSPLAFSPGENIVAELEGLRERLADQLAQFVALGTEFASCRATFRAGADDAAIAASAYALARTATLCQQTGLVAIVEPDVLNEGSHDIERCAETTQRVLRALIAALGDAGAALDAIVLQPGMVTPGRSAIREVTTAEVVAATLRALGATVPVAVAGIAFVSSGPDERIATERLCAMNRTMPRRRPWPLTFAYGRELQEQVLAVWRGHATSVAEAQRVLAHRAYCSGLAACGAYTEKVEEQLRTFTVPIAA